MRLLACTVLFLLLASPALSQSSVPAWGSYGVDTDSADRTVKPGDDFWSYVNGSWAKTVEIPADQDAFSQVQRLNKLSAAQVRAILDEMQTRRSTLNAEEQRAVDYYAALMDQTTIDGNGAAPLSADLAPIRAARDRRVLATEMGKAARLWMGTPRIGQMPRYFPSVFEVDIGQDAKEPTRYTASVSQGGLGMPNRDYYLKDDAGSLKAQSAYRDHMARMLSLTGVSVLDTPSRAAAVYAFENLAAAAHWSVIQSRDADKTYNARTLVQLEAEAPGFDWDAFLGAAGLARRPTLIIRQPPRSPHSPSFGARRRCRCCKTGWLFA